MTAQQPVHMYTPNGMSFRERVLCGQPDEGMNTHVTEFGPAVTCDLCTSIMRAREQQRAEDEGEGSDW